MRGLLALWAAALAACVEVPPPAPGPDLPDGAAEPGLDVAAPVPTPPPVAPVSDCEGAPEGHACLIDSCGGGRCEAGSCLPAGERLFSEEVASGSAPFQPRELASLPDGRVVVAGDVIPERPQGVALGFTVAGPFGGPLAAPVVLEELSLVAVGPAGTDGTFVIVAQDTLEPRLVLVFVAPDGARTRHEITHDAELRAARGVVLEDRVAVAAQAQTDPAGVYALWEVLLAAPERMARGQLVEPTLEGTSDPWLMSAAPEGGLYVARLATTAGRFAWARFDAAGQRLWEIPVDTSESVNLVGGALLPSGVSMLVARRTVIDAGGLWLGWIGAHGELLRESLELDDTLEIRAAVALAGGDVALSGARGDRLWLRRVDAEGRLVWEHVLGGPSTRARALTTTWDGGLAVLSERIGASAAAWITRTDPWGHSACELAGRCGASCPGDACARTVCALGACRPWTRPASCCSAAVPWCPEPGRCSEAGWCEDEDLVWVPAGVGPIGCDAERRPETCDPSAGPAWEASLPGFWIGRYEVSHEDWALCVAEGVCRELPRGGASSDAPVTGVTRVEAADYCGWRGRRLCSETEWERAARGTSGAPYPWGDTIDCERARYAACADSPASAGAHEGGAGPSGALNLAGNVREWVADCAHESWVGAPDGGLPWDSACSDGDRFVVRGGSYATGSAALRVWHRELERGDVAPADVGVRCCRDREAVTTQPTPIPL